MHAPVPDILLPSAAGVRWSESDESPISRDGTDAAIVPTRTKLVCLTREGFRLPRVLDSALAISLAGANLNPTKDAA